MLNLTWEDSATHQPTIRSFKIVLALPLMLALLLPAGFAHAAPPESGNRGNAHGNNDKASSARGEECPRGGCVAQAAKDALVGSLAPEPPASITVPTVPTDGYYSVSWGEGTGTISKYEVERGLEAMDWVRISDNLDLAIEQEGLAIGNYTYRARSCRISGVHTSCSVWITSPAVVVAPPTPAPQITLPATSDFGDHTVRWNEIENTRRYALQQKIGDGGWITVQDEDVLFKEYRDSEDNSYSYRVKACNAVGCSEFSDVKTVDVARKPGIPASITVPTKPTDGIFNVSWGTATGTVSRYDLDRQPKDGGYPYQGLARSYGESGLSIGSYTYNVRACNIVGAYTNCSDWRTSSEVTVAKPASAPQLGLPATSGSGDHTANWNKIENTRRYALQQNRQW